MGAAAFALLYWARTESPIPYPILKAAIHPPCALDQKWNIPLIVGKDLYLRQKSEFNKMEQNIYLGNCRRLGSFGIAH